MTECQCSIATAHKKEHCCDAFNERLIFGQLHDIECTEPKQSSGAPYCGAHLSLLVKDGPDCAQLKDGLYDGN